MCLWTEIDQHTQWLNICIAIGWELNSSQKQFPDLVLENGFLSRLGSVKFWESCLGHVSASAHFC